jgi:hypothetical protein
MEPSKFIPGNLTIRKAFVFFILLIPLAILIPGWQGFVYAPRSAYSDLTISHYPNALFLLDSLQHGQFPLWSPTILGGYPFAADPLAGLWYLPGWLAYLFPLPLGFNLNILLHLLFSGVGMWMLLREFDLEPLACLAGAFAWELLPKTFAHFGAGHLTLVYAVAWTPWLIWAEQKYSLGRKAFLSGVILGIIALADVRWAAYAGSLWLAYSIWQGIFHGNQHTLAQKGLAWGRHACETALLSLMIAAPLIVPLIEYTQLSTRSAMQVSDNLALSLSPIYLFGLVAPYFQGYAEWTVYSGGTAVIALLWSLTQPSLRKKIGFWLVVMVGALFLALGSWIPLNDLIARLPGMDLLRVPSRFMLIFGFGAAVVLAHFVQANLRDAALGSHFWGNLLTFGIAVFSWIIVAGLWVIGGGPAWAYLWGAAILTMSVVLVGLRNAGKITQIGFQAAVVILILVDLGSVSLSNFVYHSASAVLSEGADVAGVIHTQPGVFRIYTPSNSIPQQTAIENKLEMVNGIDPLQLRSFAAFVQTASGIPGSSYSVTLPPFASADPSQDNQGYTPDAERLGLLNVRFVAAGFPIQANGLALWKTVHGTYIYENQAWRPRAWVQESATSKIIVGQPIQNLQLSPDQISLNADGPGWVVLAENDYPGWQVTVDGKAQAIGRVFDLLRGVKLGPGAHLVVFSFQPLSVYFGIGLAVLGWLWAIYRWRISGR